MVISFANNKGGVGKTTLAYNTVGILLPVLEHYKIEALRQRKTLQCLLSEILFETAIERKLITKSDLEP